MCASRSVSILNASNIRILEWERETELLVRVQPYPVALTKLIPCLCSQARPVDSSKLTPAMCCILQEPSEKACRTTALLRTFSASHYEVPSQRTTSASARAFRIALPNSILIRGARAHT